MLHFTPFYGIFATEISSTDILVDRDYYVIFYIKITMVIKYMYAFKNKTNIGMISNSETVKYICTYQADYM